MAESPWICSRCGTPTNVDNCPTCFHERPVVSGDVNKPGSYLAIVQGPKGYTALPKGCAFLFLLSFLAYIVSLFQAYWRH